MSKKKTLVFGSDIQRQRNTLKIYLSKMLVDIDTWSKPRPDKADFEALKWGEICATLVFRVQVRLANFKGIICYS